MAGLSLDSRSSNSAFLSAGIFSADSIAALVFSMCSSVICALPLTFHDLAFRFADTLEWDALRNNLRFQKILPRPFPNNDEFRPQTSILCLPRRRIAKTFGVAVAKAAVLCASSTNHFSLITYHRAIAGAFPLTSTVAP